MVALAWYGITNSIRPYIYDLAKTIFAHVMYIILQQSNAINQCFVAGSNPAGMSLCHTYSWFKDISLIIANVCCLVISISMKAAPLW